MLARQARPLLRCCRSISTVVVDHYAQNDEVLPRILAGIALKGQTIESVKMEDLSAVDEFHIGGAPAALALFKQLNIQSQHAVLDVGCGLGGPARVCAVEHGCRVNGVDITPEYVSAGNTLSSWPGVALQDRVLLIVGDMTTGSATGVSDGAFDAGYMIHVGMVIFVQFVLCRCLQKFALLLSKFTASILLGLEYS